MGHFESGFKQTMLMHALRVALSLFEHMFSISIVYMAVGLCRVTQFMLTEDWLAVKKLLLCVQMTQSQEENMITAFVATYHTSNLVYVLLNRHFSLQFTFFFSHKCQEIKCISGYV